MAARGMVLPFEPLKARLLRQDAARRDAYVEKVRLQHQMWVAGLIPLDKLCSDAGDILDEYAVETLELLLSSADASPESQPPKWVLDHYHEAIGSVGGTIRDVITESAARHAVAQVLQARVLRAEAHLRQALDRR